MSERTHSNYSREKDIAIPIADFMEKFGIESVCEYGSHNLDQEG
jgi:hypothetical protein